ncbi:extracellular solute-binding protein [Paenibacillus nasutitermitis]|uniref:Sugar ABC transporter substrate-binding protein n=1 Tax=Paenibacillus nasutitermitis TaxID=1652958 RepID=A0A916YJR4_9BACL|nr:extracellular solute-binding protein [Paenibacillus nasutitermitis]GGD48508.1 sugar ABC transporter substrate-binding protein [Paenibacillus nasutitermitis]
MKKNVVTSLLAVLLMVSLVLTACSSNESGKASENTDVNRQNNADGEPVESSSKKITINLLETGWVNTPLSNDPWKPWADSRYNVDFRLTAIPGGDLQQKLTVAFASQEPPDLIFTGDKTLIEKFYKQGVLLNDYTPYLDKLPTMSQYFNDGTKAFTSREGKMIMLPLAPDKNRWTVQIRKDWLDNLGMKEPATDEELFAYLKAVTFNDPDGNNKNDTFGTTSAGTGKDLSLFSSFELMYGPTGWYIGDDGKVNSSMLDGTHKKMLDFVKRLVDEKVVDPDWYLQDWGKMGTKVHGSKAGMIWYPSRELINEESRDKKNEDYLSFWEPIPIPKGSEKGGKLGPDPIAGGVYAISANAASDPDKLDRILHILDDGQYPNEGYLGFRWGVGVPGVDQQIQKTEDGKTYINMKDDFRAKSGNSAGIDYGTWVNFNGTDPILELSEASPGKLTLTWAAAEEKVRGFDKSKNYNDLLNLDATIVSDLKKLQDEFDIQYVLGKDSNYDKFMETWLNNGGQRLLEDAAAQFKAQGLLQ